MLLFSHRGNIVGRNEEFENEPNYILLTLNLGYGCEIDLWYDGGWWSGHNNPKYKIDLSIIKECLCHAKNKEALIKLKENRLHYFWHENDQYTITSKGFIISHVNTKDVSGCIVMSPELNSKRSIEGCIGVCSDIISEYKK